MKLHLPYQKFLLSALSLFVAIAVLLTVVPAVSAEGNDPLSPIPGLGRVPNDTLIRMHKNEGTWFNDQAALLKEAQSLSKAFQTLINAEAKQGKNVAILQDGLATFDAEITACTQIHAVAGSIVFSLTGFMANGNVRDRNAAGQMLIDGRASLSESHFRLVNAMDIFSRVFDKWRATRINGIVTPGGGIGVPVFTPSPTPKGK